MYVGCPCVINSYLGGSAHFITCNLITALGGQFDQIPCVDEDTEAWGGHRASSCALGQLRTAQSLLSRTALLSTAPKQEQPGQTDAEL